MWLYLGMLGACWDYPQGDPPIGRLASRDGVVPLIGWSLGDRPFIQISVDGTLVATIEPMAQREDIEIIFAFDMPDMGPTGWAYGLNIGAFSPGVHSVSVVAKDRAGGQIDLGTRSLDLTRSEGIEDFSEILRGRPEAGSDSWLKNATSAFGFSGFAQQTMKDGGRILVVGAGIAPVVPSVIQLDIFDYPNVDVVSDSETLPFKSGVFDAVICENVIEHVPNPFTLTAEILRVCRVGGKIGINGTNLHFTHGFPSHYFNPTEFGMRVLLGDTFKGSCDFPTPASSMKTVLSYYLNALDKGARKSIEDMTLGEIMRGLVANDRDLESLMSRVSDRARRSIATNIYFAGEKTSNKRLSLRQRLKALL